MSAEATTTPTRLLSAEDVADMIGMTSDYVYALSWRGGPSPPSHSAARGAIGEKPSRNGSPSWRVTRFRQRDEGDPAVATGAASRAKLAVDDSRSAHDAPTAPGP
jgi:hypothetical protein